jgi:hypothetical protein
MGSNYLVSLYSSTKFQNYISVLSELRQIPFDDLLQDTAEEILASGASTEAQCKRALMRVADRKSRKREYEYTFNEALGQSTDYSKGPIKDWYWRGVDPRMNRDVDPETAWT